MTRADDQRHLVGHPLRRLRLPLHQLTLRTDRRQIIIDVVREAAGQPSHGFHLLGLDQPHLAVTQRRLIAQPPRLEAAEAQERHADEDTPAGEDAARDQAEERLPAGEPRLGGTAQIGGSCGQAPEGAVVVLLQNGESGSGAGLLAALEGRLPFQGGLGEMAQIGFDRRGLGAQRGIVRREQPPGTFDQRLAAEHGARERQGVLDAAPDLLRMDGGVAAHVPLHPKMRRGETGLQVSGGADEGEILAEPLLAQGVDAEEQEDRGEPEGKEGVGRPAPAPGAPSRMSSGRTGLDGQARSSRSM